MLSRFYRIIPKRDEQTDGQTIAISISRVSLLTCDKNPLASVIDKSEADSEVSPLDEALALQSVSIAGVETECV